MISDWSGISMEYAFTFERSVIFIDVPKKILNPNADDLPLEPIEISIRKKNRSCDITKRYRKDSKYN